MNSFTPTQTPPGAKITLIEKQWGFFIALTFSRENTTKIECSYQKKAILLKQSKMLNCKNIFSGERTTF